MERLNLQLVRYRVKNILTTLRLYTDFIEP
jgi:hypothetical protein